MTITVMNHVTLDGVMQGPGRKDEDPRGGFAHGGWAMEGNDEVMGQTTLQEPLPWPNSTLLEGDAADAVAALKDAQPEQQLTIMGSRSLIHALMARHLIDEWLLMIHPIVLGGGLRLFDDDVHEPHMELVDTTSTTTGVIIANYRKDL